MIPLFRKYTKNTSDKKPKILNIGSIGSTVGLPYEGYYHASKFALLGITESLKIELGKQNILVAAVLPGGIKTSFFKKSQDSAMSSIQNLDKTGKQIYAKQIEKYTKAVDKIYPLTTETKIAAKRITSLINKNKLKTRYFIGVDAKIMNFMIKYLPSNFGYWLISKII